MKQSQKNNVLNVAKVCQSVSLCCLQSPAVYIHPERIERSGTYGREVDSHAGVEEKFRPNPAH